MKPVRLSAVVPRALWIRITKFFSSKERAIVGKSLGRRASSALLCLFNSCNSVSPKSYKGKLSKLVFVLSLKRQVKLWINGDRSPIELRSWPSWRICAPHSMLQGSFVPSRSESFVVFALSNILGCVACSAIWKACGPSFWAQVGLFLITGERSLFVFFLTLNYQSVIWNKHLTCIVLDAGCLHVLSYHQAAISISGWVLRNMEECM